MLRSLNGNIGRQVWVHEPDAGSKQDRENVDQLREQFTRNRHRQKHSGDELLRYVKEATRDVRTSLPSCACSEVTL